MYGFERGGEQGRDGEGHLAMLETQRRIIERASFSDGHRCDPFGGARLGTVVSPGHEWPSLHLRGRVFVGPTYCSQLHPLFQQTSFVNTIYCFPRRFSMMCRCA